MSRLRFLSPLLPTMLAALAATWRFRESIDEECAPIIEGREPAVVAFWHGGMLPVWYRFRGVAAALVSASSDGELLAGYLRRIGYGEIVRGSSSRGGSDALAEGVALLERRTLLLTPDGPRGPARSAKVGALVAAARAGRRILLVGWSARRTIQLSSWDSMRVPIPFSRINIRYCIFPTPDVDERISDEVVERFTRALDQIDAEEES